MVDLMHCMQSRLLGSLLPGSGNSEAPGVLWSYVDTKKVAPPGGTRGFRDLLQGMLSVDEEMLSQLMFSSWHWPLLCSF